MIAKLLVAIAAALAAGPATPYGHAIFDGADPDIEIIDGRYWIYTTGGDAWSSSDAMAWVNEGKMLSLDDVAWVKDDGREKHGLWAPDVVPVAGRYFYYYAVGPQAPGKPSRIGLAICDSPKGPCSDTGKPLLTGDDSFEAIDPMVFTDPASGVTYLYAGGSAGADASRLRIYRLSADRRSIAAQVTAPGRSEAYQPRAFTEGAFMARIGRDYYLSYSVGHWNRADYRVRYVRSRTPVGPWRDARTPVVLQSHGAIKGPGHHALVRDPRTGRWTMAYHRWENVAGDGPYRGAGVTRKLALAPVTFDRSGNMRVVDPAAQR